MEIPQYIHEHIEKNNKLLRQALKHQSIVEEWYDKKLVKLDYERIDEVKGISYEDMCGIMGNPDNNNMIFEDNIMFNFRALEKLKLTPEEEKKWKELQVEEK